MSQDKKDSSDKRDDHASDGSERHDRKSRDESNKDLSHVSEEVRVQRQKQFESGKSGVSEKHKLTPAKELLGDLAHAPQTKAKELNAKAADVYKAAGFGNPDSPVGKAQESTADNADYGKYRVPYEKEKQEGTDRPLLKVNLSAPVEAVKAAVELNETKEAKQDASTEISPEKRKLAQLESATQQMLVSASHRFGEEQIAAMKIAKDDVGRSISALLLGPDVCNLMGEDEARKLGKRLIVFGVAPMFGMADEAKKQLAEHTKEAIHEGSSNFLIGTAIGAVLERCHPVVLGTVTVGAGGAFLNDQLGSPEHKKRNEEILQISAEVDNASNAALVKFSERTRQLIGPEIYHGGFVLATGGAGLPEGKALRQAAENEGKARLAKVDIQKIAANFHDLGNKALDSIGAIFGEKPRWALAGGPHEAFLSSIEKEQADSGVLRMVGEAKSSPWKAPIQKLQGDLDTLAKKPFEELCEGLQASQSELIALNREPVLAKSQVDELIALENKFQSQYLKLKDEVAGLRKDVEQIEKKDPNDWTAAEQMKADKFYAGEDALYGMLKERLEKVYGWNSRHGGSLDRSISLAGGIGTQARINGITSVLSGKLEKNPEIIKVFTEKGISLERAKDWVGIPMTGNPAADHAGCDYLLVNKQTGEMHCFDVTQRANLFRSKRLVDSPLTNSGLGIIKDVPKEREYSVIGVDENTHQNMLVSEEFRLKRDPEFGRLPRIEREAMARQTLIELEKQQLAEIIARTISTESKLNIFTTRLPSGDPTVPISRQVFELHLFRKDLESIGFREWAGSMIRSRDQIKSINPGLPYYD